MQRELFKKKTDIALVLDFDGTVTRSDVVDGLVQRYARNAETQKAEREWIDGLISSDECMARQLRSVRISRKEMDRFLGAITLDPGFSTLMEYADKSNIPLVILSDGFDLIIRKILAFRKIRRMTFKANRLSHKGLKLYPSFPYKNQRNAAACSRCAHCKRITLQENRHRVGHYVYVGDGLSDRCVLDVADTVFAKGDLAESCEKSQKDYHEYNTLDEVAERLSGILTRLGRPVLQEVG